jgi:DNA-binding SARP family transcriptional activator
MKNGTKTRISIQTFGDVSFSENGKPLNPPFNLIRLLVYILLEGHGKPVMRRRVGDLIWSDNGSQQAGADIRQALVRIRRFQLEHELQLLAVDSRLVWLTLADDINFDLAEFIELAANPTLPGCVQMCSLYNGELLSSLRTAGEGFEEGLADQRNALRNDFVSAVSEAVLPDSALSSHDRHFCAQSLLRVDPYHEGAHRALMRVAAENGQFSFLRKLFGDFTHKLRNELGVTPDEETVRLYQRLISQAHAT